VVYIAALRDKAVMIGRRLTLSSRERAGAEWAIEKEVISERTGLNKWEQGLCKWMGAAWGRLLVEWGRRPQPTTTQIELVVAAEKVRRRQRGEQRWTVDAVFISAITLKWKTVSKIKMGA
jgi:hypothetical protein